MLLIKGVVSVVVATSDDLLYVRSKKNGLRNVNQYPDGSRNMCYEKIGSLRAHTGLCTSP